MKKIRFLNYVRVCVLGVLCSLVIIGTCAEYAMAAASTSGSVSFLPMTYETKYSSPINTNGNKSKAVCTFQGGSYSSSVSRCYAYIIGYEEDEKTGEVKEKLFASGAFYEYGDRVDGDISGYKGDIKGKFYGIAITVSYELKTTN